MIPKFLDPQTIDSGTYTAWNTINHEFKFQYYVLSKDNIILIIHNLNLYDNCKLSFKKDFNSLKFEKKFYKDECNPNRVVNNFTNRLINLLKRNNIIDIDAVSNSEKLLVSLKPHVLLNVL